VPLNKVVYILMLSEDTGY